MSKSPKVILVSKNRKTEVSPKTAAKVPAEINRRRDAEDRKNGK